MTRTHSVLVRGIKHQGAKVPYASGSEGLFQTPPFSPYLSSSFRLALPYPPAAAPGEQVDPDDGSRHNTGAKHEEGMKHITPELRKAASLANQVDEALHEFVSAKFCDRLREASLLDHPLVAGELATNELLDER